MIDFATLQGLTIPEGNVTQIADAAGNVLWKQAPAEATVTITGYGGNYHCYVTINGTMYYTANTLVVPVGTVVACYAFNDGIASYVTLNGVTVSNNATPYNYTVNGNVTINLEYLRNTEDKEYGGRIYITET